MDYFCNETYNIWGVDIRNDLLKMLALDCIILNEDSHFANFGLCYNHIMNIYTYAPIFDNGLSLLANLNTQQSYKDIDLAIRKVKIQPFTTSINKQAKAIISLTSEPILRFNITMFTHAIAETDFSLYNELYVNRALFILEQSLKKWEGVLWQRI